MNRKPERYGMKIGALCDVKKFYCWNMQVYTGKMNSEPEVNQGERVVLDMADELSLRYSITANNFFTCLAVSKQLLKQPKNIWHYENKPKRGSFEDLYCTQVMLYILNRLSCFHVCLSVTDQ